MQRYNKIWREKSDIINRDPYKMPQTNLQDTSHTRYNNFHKDSLYETRNSFANNNP